MTRHVGIIGYPLGHSISPAFQQAAFDELGIDCSYERWPTPPDELEERIRSLRKADVLGANVTVPHKQAVLKLVDVVSKSYRTSPSVAVKILDSARSGATGPSRPRLMRPLGRRSAWISPFRNSPI